jgi:hypothetical protein
MAPFACSAADLQAVTALVADPAIAATVCSRVDVAGAGSPVAAVLRHLAASAAGPGGEAAVDEVQHSTNTMFLLFSGYLVFMMQAGFALVSPRAGRAQRRSRARVPAAAKPSPRGGRAPLPAACGGAPRRAAPPWPVRAGGRRAPPARARASLRPPRPPQLCAGHMRVKNSNNILLKNLLDCVIGTITWLLIG